VKTTVAVDEDINFDTKDDEDEVAAFQNQKNTRFPNKAKN